eukprot:385421-Pyramimonas_sp.AAC.1
MFQLGQFDALYMAMLSRSLRVSLRRYSRVIMHRACDLCFVKLYVCMYHAIVSNAMYVIARIPVGHIAVTASAAFKIQRTR